MATQAEKILIRLTKYSGKVSTVVDATNSFNTTGTYYQDLSGWDAAVVQVVNSDDTIYFKTTNDDNSATSNLLPAPEVPVNWVSVLGVDLSSKSDTDNINGSGIVEFAIIGKYLQLVGNTYDNPLSYGYFLSYFNYSNINDAYESGLSQGSRVVYAATDSQSGVQEFFADSRLTQPIIDGSGNWYAFALITDYTSIYACTISADGLVSVD